jgi:thioredoxin 1
MRPLQSLALSAAIIAVPANAGTIRPYDAAAFHALQTRNAPAIVFVHAAWCPICRAQQQTISKLLTTPEYRAVTVFTIDYDTQKPLWTSFGAQKQSTLIAFHGRRETARLAYDADPDKVTGLVRSALK